ncbi:MAG: peptidylprolyl isomerase [Clostridia bacterium]|nr:peptidylprolyl isomerase [Clostridia bacterium]
MLLDAKRNLYEAEPAFKAHLAKVKDDLLTSYATEKVISQIRISDKDAEEYYENNKEKFKSGETANANHILVDSEELAKEILEKINSGATTFEAAATEYSSCPSKENGGSLGDFGRGQMVPEFDSAVFAMSVGKISGPVKTQFGYHLIRLNSKSDSSVMPFAQISEDIKNALLVEKQRAAYDSKINQLKILYPVDMMTI